MTKFHSSSTTLSKCNKNTTLLNKKEVRKHVSLSSSASSTFKIFTNVENVTLQLITMQNNYSCRLCVWDNEAQMESDVL